MQEKEYPFPESEVTVIMDQLLEEKLIELAESKCLEEIGCTDHPKYCKYHRIVGHPIEKCFVLKDLIVRLAKENKIDLDLTETAEANCTMITFGSFEPIPIIKNKPQYVQPIKSTVELPEGDVKVNFIVDNKVTTVYAYPGMLEP